MRVLQLPDMFNSSEEFDAWFGNKLAAGGATAADVDAPGASSVLHAEQVLIITNRLHQVLRPFLLRRTKAVLKTELPSKTERAIACPMSEYQVAMLQLLREKGKAAQTGSVTGINNVVMGMRKVWPAGAACTRCLRVHCNTAQLQVACGIGQASKHKALCDCGGRAGVQRSAELKAARGGGGRGAAGSLRARLCAARRQDGCPHTHLAAPRARWCALPAFNASHNANGRSLERLPQVSICKSDRHVDARQCSSTSARMAAGGAGHKLLLFSTMTTQLDSCEEVLEWQGLRWERLDGTSKASERGALLHSFSTNPDVRAPPTHDRKR